MLRRFLHIGMGAAIVFASVAVASTTADAASVIKITGDKRQDKVDIEGSNQGDIIVVANGHVLTNTKPNVGAASGCTYVTQKPYGHITSCPNATWWNVHGRDGNDRITVDIGDEDLAYLYGDNHNDTLTLNSPASAEGNKGDDELFGSPLEDSLRGGDGADTIHAEEAGTQETDIVFCSGADGDFASDTVDRGDGDRLFYCGRNDVVV